MSDDPDTELLNPFPDRDGSRNDRDVRIRQRAYDLWVAEGSPQGRQQEHWLQAEREIMMAEPESSIGMPTTPLDDIPSTSLTDTVSERNDPQPAVPKTSGAAKPGPDTSRSGVANRDVAGPRKAGATPRPTRKPLG